MLTILAVILLQPAVPPETIIVVGRRAVPELEACLARSCPPAEEIEAALDASVEQFANGDYRDARSTLSRAISRNRRYAEQHPELVSSLYSTHATVSLHEGEDDVYRRSTLTGARILKTHLGPDQPETIWAELDVGDMYVETRKFNSASGAYRRAQDAAIAIGRPRVAALATVRRASLALGLGHHRQARDLLDEAVAIVGEQDQLFSNLRTILLMRIEIAKGNEGAIDTYISRMRGSAEAPPQLAHAPPYGQVGRALNGFAGPLQIRWADVGFWVRPDGRTGGAQTLRVNGDDGWTAPILEQIAARRYLPTAATEPGDPGRYRIERFTLRSSWDVPLGSRIKTRVGGERLFVADLTYLGEPREQMLPPS